MTCTTEIKPPDPKELLVDAAKEKFGYDIIMPGNRRNFSDCFTRNGDYLYFWFNTPKDNSTHAIKMKVAS